MLCQNCGKYEATTHLRRIINGEVAQMHLCSRCAAAMGYSRGISPFGIGFGSLLDGLFGDIPAGIPGSRTLRCDKCGCSFDDIVKNGRVGCPECYALFYDRLSQTVGKIHGSAVYEGGAEQAQESVDPQDKIAELKQKLKDAVEQQNFEDAVKLRDEIRALEG